MKRLAAPIAILLTGLSACRPPPACQDVAGQDVLINTTPISGAWSQALASAGDTAPIVIRANAQNLPDLLSVQLHFDVSLAYETDPKGSDGVTQMPTLSISTSGVLNAPNAQSTYSFPKEDASYFSVPLFETCGFAGEVGCCPSGAPDCSLEVAIDIKRVDGWPFPPILVSWTADIGAEIGSCERSSSPPKFQLVQASP